VQRADNAVPQRQCTWARTRGCELQHAAGIERRLGREVDACHQYNDQFGDGGADIGEQRLNESHNPAAVRQEALVPGDDFAPKGTAAQPVVCYLECMGNTHEQLCELRRHQAAEHPPDKYDAGDRQDNRQCQRDRKRQPQQPLQKFRQLEEEHGGEAAGKQQQDDIGKPPRDQRRPDAGHDDQRLAKQPETGRFPVISCWHQPASVRSGMTARKGMHQISALC